MELIVLKIQKEIDGENVVLHPVLLKRECRSFLVDCGYEETFDVLQALLELSGVGHDNLTGVIITHDDHDHLGSLKLLKQHYAGLKVYCGVHEVESVTGAVNSERLQQAESLLDAMPEDRRGWALGFIQRLRSVQRVEVDRGLEDKELFEQEVVVVHTPGHTRGHISLFYPKDGILVAGDALVVENGNFEIANPSYTLDMKAAVESVERIRSLNPKMVICYHGGMIDSNVDEKLVSLIERYKPTIQTSSYSH